MAAESKGRQQMGAMMLTPPKILSKMGARKEGVTKGLERQPSSLDEIMEDMRAERRKKIREKEKFEESGWRRIEDIAKWQWTYYKVPSDKKELMIDMEGQERGKISKLKIFSLYFSEELLSFITSKRESEMAEHWSPTGYGLTLNLKMIKQVQKKRKKIVMHHLRLIR